VSTSRSWPLVRSPCHSVPFAVLEQGGDSHEHLDRVYEPGDDNGHLAVAHAAGPATRKAPSRNQRQPLQPDDERTSVLPATLT
jgi:hypothetical protein